MPTANHRRPLPFEIAHVAERCRKSSARLSEHVFPQPLWKHVGEHLGKDGGEDQEEAEEEVEEEEEGASWELLGALLRPP